MRPSRKLDYGLVAEEVAEIYPDLVVRNKNDQVETVQYHKLTPMLLNELQKLHGNLQSEQELNRQQSEKIKSLESRLTTLETLLSGTAMATMTPAH